MKFTYEKYIPKLVTSDSSPTVEHRFTLEGSPFTIEASSLGVRLIGSTEWFQPEEGEVHLPVDHFREFMTRLASAFDLAWKEQERARKEAAARQMILGAR